MGRWLVKNGGRIFAPDEAIQGLLDKGWSLEGETVVESDTGLRLLDPESASELTRAGRVVPEATGAGSRGAAAFNEAEREGLTNGVLAGVQAFGESGLSTLTLGAADPLLENISEATGGDPESVALRAQERPGFSLAGSIVGGIAGGLAGTAKSGAVRALGGPLGLGSRAAAGIGSRIGGVAGSVAEGATEGFVFGGAQALSNTLLHDKAFSAEAIAAEMGTGALLGAATGGVLGVAGLGLNKFGSRIKPSQFKKLHDGFDPKSVFTSEVSEAVTTAFRDQSLAAKQVTAAINKLRDDFVSSGAGTFSKEVSRELSTKLASVNRAFGNSTDDFIKRIDSWTPDNVDQKILEVVNAQRTLNELHKEYKLADFGVQLKPTDLKTRITELAAKSKIPTEEVVGAVESLENPGLVDRLARLPVNSEFSEGLINAWATRRLQKIGSGAAEVTTPHGKSILGKLGERLTDRAVKSATGAIVGTSVGGPIGGLLGAMAGSTSSVREKIATGIKTFIGAAKGGTKITRPAAIAILERSRIESASDGPSKTPLKTDPTKRSSPRHKLDAAFQKNAESLRATAADPLGLEQKLRAKFQGMAFLDPEIADLIVQNALKRAAYLFDHLPVTERPNPFRPGNNVLSSEELNSFVGKLYAADHPVEAILHGMETGRLNKETVECVKELHPEIFLEFQRNLMEAVIAHPRELPYPKRIQVSILFDIPADETMQPEMIKTLRNNYIEREEAAGQTSGGSPGGGGQGPTTFEHPTAVQALGLK